jgi:hypothetical protein
MFDPSHPGSYADVPPVDQDVWVWDDVGEIPCQAHYDQHRRSWVEGWEIASRIRGEWWQPITEPGRPDARPAKRYDEPQRELSEAPGTGQKQDGTTQTVL